MSCAATCIYIMQLHIANVLCRRSSAFTLAKDLNQIYIATTLLMPDYNLLLGLEIEPRPLSPRQPAEPGKQSDNIEATDRQSHWDHDLAPLCDDGAFVIDFFAFPVELRLLIYHFCLFVGVVCPYAKRLPYRDYPNVKLLRTCKAIYSEAEPLIFKNRFTFSTPAALQKLFDQSLMTPYRKSRVLYLGLIFRWTGLSEKQADQVLDEAHRRQFEDTIDEPESETTASLIKHIHQQRKVVLINTTWQSMTGLVLEHLRPRHLNIDLNNCLDRTKCCSLQSAAISTFLPGFREAVPLRSIKLRGIYGFDDRKTMSTAEILLLSIIKVRTSLRADECPIYPSALDAPLSREAEKYLLKEAESEVENDGGNWWGNW